MLNNIRPIIAIIVPARNEEKYIGQLIDSILNSNYDKNKLRVYICDGLSTDKTQEIVQAYSAKHKVVHLLLNENKTTPYAFNLGIKNATEADIMVTVSAHAEIYPDFFESIVKAFEISSEIGCVGGVSDNVYDDETSQAIGLAMSSSFGVGNAHFRTGGKEGYVDTVSYPAYKKEVFEKTGLFNEALTRNQDDEYNYRVVKAGYKIYLSKSIRSKYYVRGTFEKVFRQYYQYGYWKVYVNKLHSTVTSTRQLVPPAFVLFLLVGFILSCLTYIMALLYLGALGFYVACAFAFAAKAAGSFKQTLKIAWTFVILHVGYGTGYLKGIIDFTLLGKSPSKKAEELTR
jgi:glycosyltransferase involved in cell wall biosynthesis